MSKDKIMLEFTELLNESNLEVGNKCLAIAADFLYEKKIADVDEAEWLECVKEATKQLHSAHITVEGKPLCILPMTELREMGLAMDACCSFRSAEVAQRFVASRRLVSMKVVAGPCPVSIDSLLSE
jgi:hypothetical protein